MDDSIKIELVEFDCGLLAPKVGKILFNEEINKFSEFENECICQIEKENYSFCYITSKTPLNFKKIEKFGCIESYRVNISEFKIKLNKYMEIKSSDSFLEFDGTSWERIEELLNFGYKTRFWRDTRIPPTQVIKHKIKSLKHYQKKFPELFKVLVKDSQIQGFLCCFLDNADLHLYELVLNPISASALTPVYLINSVLDSKVLKKIKSIETRIYDDNKKMIKFCKKSGFSKTNSEYFYHFWTN